MLFQFLITHFSLHEQIAVHFILDTEELPQGGSAKLSFNFNMHVYELAGI